MTQPQATTSMHPIDRTAGIDHVNRSVLLVREAQSAWERTSLRDRSRHMRQIRQYIVSRQDEIASVISRETTRPRTETLMQEVTASLALLRHLEKQYPKWLKDSAFRELKPGFWAKSNRRVFDAIGVIAVIGPSTFPFSLVIMQTCAALMCGNVVVLKPSEKCPETAALLKTIFSVLPTNVVRVIEGDASVVEAIISDPEINKVLFTGSSSSGRHVAELCGKHFKPCLLELGGYGTAIVCDDADLDLTASGLLWSASYANGNACIGTRRVLASPEVSAQLYEKLHILNCSLVEGSTGVLHSDVAAGFRLRIRVSSLAAASGSHQTESKSDGEAGPILEIVPVTGTEEAIKLVNDSVFGLSASIWSRNVAEAQSIARRLKVGMVWINDASVALPDFPWGGVRDSGWGSLFSRESIPELTRMKTISAERRRFWRAKLWWFPYSGEKYEMTRAANAFLFGSGGLKSSTALVGATWRFLIRRTDADSDQQQPVDDDIGLQR